MNKIILVSIGVPTLLVAIWVMPMMQQQAFANWGNWYQCGSGQYQSGGSTYYYQWTCRAYYNSGTSGFLDEIIGHYCQWKYLGFGGWQFIGCSSDQVLYYCNPSHYPIQCGTF
jgi:hypothetical protein